MAEVEGTPPETTPPEGEGGEKTEDQRVPYERFQQANKKAKEAADKAKTLEKELADIRSQMEEREQQGLPELDRIKKAAELAEKRAAEAEKRAEQAERDREHTRKERWVTAAAKDFVDPDDATRYVDFDGIEDEKDAERAVKAVAKAKPHLVRADDPKLPGRVLDNGRKAEQQDGRQQPRVSAESDAEVVGNALQEFLKGRAGGFPA